jgi:hypothetical protein
MLLHMCMFVKQNDKAIYFQYTLARENGTFELRYGTPSSVEEKRYKSFAAKDTAKERYLKYCRLDWPVSIETYHIYELQSNKITEIHKTYKKSLVRLSFKAAIIIFALLALD